MRSMYERMEADIRADERKKVYASLAATFTKYAGVMPVLPKRKHKKHMHKKTCDKCGKAARGTQGLAMHQLRAHGGRNWSRNGSATPAQGVS